MKKRQSSTVIFLGKGRLGQHVGRETGVFTVAVFIQNGLETFASGRFAMQSAIRFAQEEAGLGSPRRIRILIEKFFELGESKVVELAPKQRVSVLQLPLIGRFGLGRSRLG